MFAIVGGKNEMLFPSTRAYISGSKKQTLNYLKIQSTTHNVSKTLFFIEFHPQKPEISSILCRKTREINKNTSREKIIMNLFDFVRFLTQNVRYFWSLWIDFDEKKAFLKRYEFFFE